MKENNLWHDKSLQDAEANGLINTGGLNKGGNIASAIEGAYFWGSFISAD